MRSSQPFAPPRELGPAVQTEAATIAAVWAVAGGLDGASVGFTFDLLGWREGALVLGALGALAGGGLGFLAWRVDRTWSDYRAALPDGRGQLARPARAWVMAVPLAALALGLAWLVVVGTVRAESASVGAVFLALAVGVLTLFRPLLARRAVTRAIEAVMSARLAEARQRLLAVHRSWWAPGLHRSLARLNLAMLAIRAGETAEADGWYAAVGHPRLRAQASTGRALVAVLEGAWAEAEAYLGQAAAAGQSPALQAEVDGVRLLLLLRRDGAADARRLGEQLLSAEAGTLFLGVLAVARQATGDREGAEGLVGPGIRHGLEQSGLLAALPELS